MQAAAEGSLLCTSPPSFNSYSSDKLAMVAARVIQECHSDSHHCLSSGNNTACHPNGLFDYWNSVGDSNFLQQVQRIHADHDCEDGNGNKEGVDVGDDEFEFALVCRDEANASPISADAVFNGQIKPMYPIFDQSLLIDCAEDGIMDDTNEDDSASNGLKPAAVSNDKGTRQRRPPLKKLMFEERGTVLCSSWVSEDVSDLDELQPGTYCVWNPKPGRESSRKKSISTGFASKRWNLRNLLVRSRSDGKRSHVSDWQTTTPSDAAKSTEMKKSTVIR